jgi:hypothetical protein
MNTRTRLTFILTLGLACAVTMPSEANEWPGATIEGDLARVKWLLQVSQHQSFPKHLAIVIESRLAEDPVVVHVHWNPLVCDGQSIPLDPKFEPAFEDLVGTLPKSYIIEPAGWRAVLLPVGIPHAPHTALLAVPQCVSEFVVRASTADGRGERLVVQAPIEVRPREER